MVIKRGQISTEYLIVVGFVVFVLIGILGVAVFYSGGISDKIKVDQVRNFAVKVISSSEQVYYSGEPSKVVINAYLPSGVTGLDIIENSLVFNISTNSGDTRIAFGSDVDISGSLSYSGGVKRISVSSTSSGVVLSED
jgi:uncharacterized protein (UPF0333 family)